jgi:hypothetical protein
MGRYQLISRLWSTNAPARRADVQACAKPVSPWSLCSAAVTLILGMSKPDGIYLSVDYRITNSRTGKRIDDAAVKHLQVTYPPDETGPRALFAYAGLAILPDGTPTGTWIKDTLRGESDVFDVSMQHLRDRLDRDVARLRRPLIINVLVVQGEHRFLGGFSNVSKSISKVMPGFEYRMYELDAPLAFANGLAAARVKADQHLNQMQEQAHIKPRKPMDHMNLLAAINRRVAASEKTVSPHCHVAYLPANRDDQPGPQSQVFAQGRESVPFTMPALLFGVDLSFVEQFQAQAKRIFAGEELELRMDADAINEQQRRRP